MRRTSVDDVADQGPPSDLHPLGRVWAAHPEPRVRIQVLDSVTLLPSFCGEAGRAFEHRPLIVRSTNEHVVAHAQAFRIGVYRATRSSRSPTTMSSNWSQQCAQNGQVRTPKIQSTATPCDAR